MYQKFYNPKSHAPALYVPNWLSQIKLNLLSANAKFLYGRLAQWSTETGEVYRTSKQLAEEIGASQRNIERYIKELKDKKLIETYHPKMGGVNYFRFLYHEWMDEKINEHLVYKQDRINPPTNLSEPTDKNDGTLPTNLSDINNIEIKEIKLCGAKASHTGFNTKKEQEEKKAKEDEKAITLFNEKFAGYDVTLEKLFSDCQKHYEQKRLWVTRDRFLKWIETEKIENHKKTKVVSDEDEQDRLKRYAQERENQRKRLYG